MDEAQAIRERPRTPYSIQGELNSAYKTRDEARKLVAECAALDMRPFVIVGGEIIYERDFNIPENIKQFSHDAALAVAKLELELYEAMRNRHY